MMNEKVKRYLQIYLGPAGLFLLILFGMWQLNALFYIATLVFMGIFFSRFFSTSREKLFRLHYLDIIAIGLAVTQYLLFLLSDSRPQGVKYLCSSLFAITIYFLFRIVGFRGQNRRSFFVQSMAIWCGLLGLVTLLGFSFFRFNIQYEGFDDVINFRSLYHPVGMLSNDWVGFLLLLLPISGVAYVAASNKYLKWVAAGSAALLCFGLVISFSRAAFVSLTFFVLAFVVLMLVWKIKKLKSYFLAGVLIVIIVLEALPFRNDVITTLGMAKTTSQVRSINGRKLLWEGAWKMFEDHPIKGVGCGNFIVSHNQYLNRTKDSFFTGRVTNSYLQLLAEQGMIGFIAWFLFVSGMVFILWKIGINKNTRHKERLQAAIFLSGFLAFGSREIFFSSFFENIGLQVLVAVIAAWSVNVFLFRNKNEIRSKDSKLIRQFNVLNPHWGGIILCLGICIAGSVYLFKAQRSSTNNQEFINSHAEENYDHAEKAIIKAISFQNDNALFYANRALLCDALVREDLISSYLKGSGTALNHKSVDLESPINDLKKAIELNPNDAMFHHNLGWLYIISGDSINGKKQLEKALELEPFTSIYQVSMGVYLYQQNEVEASRKCFYKAAKYSPDLLDSKFWTDLSQTDSTFQARALRESLKIASDNNPILCSRQAKIYLHQGDTARADSLISFVTGALPNLNRPWCYHGKIKLAQGDTTSFKTAMSRSMLLDGRDYLPPLALAQFHDMEGQVYDAIYYYRLALNNYQNIYSPHYQKTEKYYQSRTLLNDVIPSQLLYYTKPFVDVKGVCKRLVALYEQKEKGEMAQYFQDYLAEKRTLEKALKLSGNGI